MKNKNQKKMKKPKVAIIIGHTKFSQGAYSKTFRKTEYKFYKDMQPRLQLLGDVFTHNAFIPSYTKRQIHTALKTSGYDVVYELHFNAFNGEAKGVEAKYYYNSLIGNKLADKFCDDYSFLTGANNRGSKGLSDKTQRGFGFVKHQKPVAVLLEPFFGDNPFDCMKFKEELFLNSLDRNIEYYSEIS